MPKIAPQLWFERDRVSFDSTPLFFDFPPQVLHRLSGRCALNPKPDSNNRFKLLFDALLFSSGLTMAPSRQPLRPLPQPRARTASM